MELRRTFTGTNGYKEKRKSPRLFLDLPIDYRVMGMPQSFGAVVYNGSEVGLRIHSVRNIPIGAKLVVAVLFPKEYQLANFEVLAEVVWKDLHWEEDWEGYQYGLRFVQIKEQDLLTLQQLLSHPPEIEDILREPRSSG